MTLDSALLVAFLAAFLRTSAMVFASPLFSGTSTPVIVRVFFSFALSLALAPALQSSMVVPPDMYALAGLAFTEIVSGLMIGFAVQMVLLGAQVAGAFLDMQVGFGLASVLAPNNSLPATILSKFKFMLAMVVFLSINGHHMLMQALTASYGATSELTARIGLEMALDGLWKMSLIALQIALPVAAVSFIVDACLGIISRAVPQINVLMAGISAKLLVGLIGLSLALPAVAAGVTHGVDVAQDMIVRMFR